MDAEKCQYCGGEAGSTFDSFREEYMFGCDSCQVYEHTKEFWNEAMRRIKARKEARRATDGR